MKNVAKDLKLSQRVAESQQQILGGPLAVSLQIWQWDKATEEEEVKEEEEMGFPFHICWYFKLPAAETDTKIAKDNSARNWKTKAY